jgi:hypothetical protein
MENGDHFQIADVIFAVNMFVTGISLVIRTNSRWAIIFVGGFFFVCGVIYMLTISWTFS